MKKLSRLSLGELEYLHQVSSLLRLGFLPEPEDTRSQYLIDSETSLTFDSIALNLKDEHLILRYTHWLKVKTLNWKGDTVVVNCFRGPILKLTLPLNLYSSWLLKRKPYLLYSSVFRLSV